MSYYSNTFLALPEFITTCESKTKIIRGIEITTIFGKMTSMRPCSCPVCGSKFLHTHQQHRFKLKHLAVGNALMLIDVTYLRWLCNRCGKLINQPIPFKQKGHFITKTYFRQMIGLLERGNVSLQHVAQIMHTNKNC
jgi:transposase